MKNIILTYLPKSQVLVKLFFLLLLLHTTSCGNPSVSSTSTFSDNRTDNTGGKPSSGPIDVELTSSGQVASSDTITFQLTNKSSNDIDLERVIIDLEISEKKDFSNKSTNKGGIAPVCANSAIQLGGGKSVKGRPASTFIGLSTLLAGKSADIQVRITELEELASATITCRLAGCTSKTGDPVLHAVPVKFSAPAVDPQKGDITATIQKAQFTGATNELSLEFAFQNVSNHTVSLASLQFNLELDGTITGKATYSSQEFFNSTSIVEPTKTVTTGSIRINIKDTMAINNLRLAVGAENLIFTKLQTITKEGEVVCDVKQPIKLTSPDIAINEIGPKEGSKIEYILDPQKITLQNNALVLPIVFHNTSDHAIDLRKLNHMVKLEQNDQNIFSDDNKKINWSKPILEKGESRTLNYSLGPDLSSHILQNYDAENTFEFITQFDQQVISSVKQPFKVKVGPIAGESRAEINMLNTITLVDSTNANEYKARFSFEVKNTSDHPIDFEKVAFDIDTNIAINEEPRNFSNIQYTLGSKKLLNPGIKCTLPIEVELGAVTKEQAENFLTNGSFQFEIIMKTMDGSDIGAGQGTVQVQ